MKIIFQTLQKYALHSQNLISILISFTDESIANGNGLPIDFQKVAIFWLYRGQDSTF